MDVDTNRIRKMVNEGQLLSKDQTLHLCDMFDDLAMKATELAGYINQIDQSILEQALMK